MNHEPNNDAYDISQTRNTEMAFKKIYMLNLLKCIFLLSLLSFTLKPASAKDNFIWKKQIGFSFKHIFTIGENVIGSYNGYLVRITACEQKICVEPWEHRESFNALIQMNFPYNYPDIYENKSSLQSTMAWYEKPTTRYAHGVLGDKKEGSRLAIHSNFKTYYQDLNENEVFEDIHPRIIDLNQDGQLDVMTIVSTHDLGARIRIYTIENNQIKILAETEAIGKGNRWLNPVGFSDFNGDGTKEIALVRTPHIGGILERWQYNGDGLERLVHTIADVSNHEIGSPILNNHAILDYNSDGIDDILIPNQSRNKLKIISLVDPAKTLKNIDLPSPLKGGLAVFQSYKGKSVLMVLEDGVYMLLSE